MGLKHWFICKFFDLTIKNIISGKKCRDLCEIILFVIKEKGIWKKILSCMYTVEGFYTKRDYELWPQDKGINWRVY